VNTTLPPTRDLPPHAHARIRGRLELAVTRRRRTWLVPALSGVVALLLIAFFAWPDPAPRDIDRPPARPGVTAPPSTPTISPAPEHRPAPDVPGVSPASRAYIEKNCATMLDVRDAVLYQLVKDAAGEGALLYTRSGMAVDCQPGKPETFYNPTASVLAALDWLPGPMSVDTNYAQAGGDSWLGHPGLQSYAGRVTSAVARVTYTDSGVTQRALVANGTFYLRIVRPSDWVIPADPVFGVLRAYDADGAVLATIDLSTFHPFCLRLPDGKLVPKGTAVAPEDCHDGVPWR
jgi:hypothetical protein